MRLTKKIFSIIALMLICFSAFAFAGCDSAKNKNSGLKLTVTGSISEVTRLTQNTYEGDDWLEELGKKKSEYMSNVKIKLGDFEYKSGTWYYNAETDTWTTTAPNDKDKKKYKKFDFSNPYQHFVADGGQVSFNISLNPGKYQATFSHSEAANQVKLNYTIK